MVDFLTVCCLPPGDLGSGLGAFFLDKLLLGPIFGSVALFIWAVLVRYASAILWLERHTDAIKREMRINYWSKLPHEIPEAKRRCASIVVFWENLSPILVVLYIWACFLTVPERNFSVILSTLCLFVFLRYQAIEANATQCDLAEAERRIQSPAKL